MINTIIVGLIILAIAVPFGYMVIDVICDISKRVFNVSKPYALLLLNKLF